MGPSSKPTTSERKIRQAQAIVAPGVRTIQRSDSGPVVRLLAGDDKTRCEIVARRALQEGTQKARWAAPRHACSRSRASILRHATSCGARRMSNAAARGRRFRLRVGAIFSGFGAGAGCWWPAYATILRTSGQFDGGAGFLRNGLGLFASILPQRMIFSQIALAARRRRQSGSSVWTEGRSSAGAITDSNGDWRRARGLC